MALNSCLARIAGDKVAMLEDVLKVAGGTVRPTLAALDVAKLGRLGPAFMICDIDGLDGDPFETLRQLRFVLPRCIVVVYTIDVTFGWGIACHLAGANGLLCKESTPAELVSGVRLVLRSGCYTDPRFAAA